MSLILYEVEYDENIGMVISKYRVRKCNDLVDYKILIEKKELEKYKIINKVQRWNVKDSGKILSIEESKKANSLLKKE